MVKNGTTKTQRAFLRALHENPGSPPPDLWPAPAILRRWLRKPGFRTALETVRDTLTFQAEFNFAAAVSDAAQRLASARDKPLSHQDLRAITQLLRLAHAKNRFPVRNLNLQSPATFEWAEALRLRRDQDPDQDPDPWETLLHQLHPELTEPVASPPDSK
jgi:hypothetical protein